MVKTVTFFWPNKPIRVYDNKRLLSSLPADQWIVQPKWNGKRVMTSCDAEGKVVLYGRQNQVFPEQWPWLSMLPLPRPWFTDGELLRDGRILIWDFALLGGEKVFTSPYESRLKQLQDFIPKPLCHGKQTIGVVETLPAASYEAILARKNDPHLEGIVFKKKDATNLWGPFSTSEVGSQFKYRIKD